MIRTEIALDIGSRRTKLAVKNRNMLPLLGKNADDTVIYTEESCVASSRSETDDGEILVGNAALDSRLECVYPIHEGCAANSRLLALLIRRLASEKSGRRKPNQEMLHIAVSRALGTMKLRNLERAMQNSGFRYYRFHDAALIAAMGAGIDISRDSACMIVNIGAETLSVAVTANGGLLWESMIPGGSRRVNRAITTLIQRERGVLIGDRMAELIKLNIGSPSFIVDGRDVRSGLPRTVTIERDELSNIISAAVGETVDAVKDALKAIQPDAAADIVDSGILLVGGGARLCGLRENVERIIGVGISIAPNAETAVIDGLKQYALDGKAGAETWQGYTAVEADLA